MKQKGKDRRRLKKPVRIGMVIMAMVMALFVGTGIISNQLMRADAADTLEPSEIFVDPDTTNDWSVIAASSTNTQNIGRIWTDKSVFDNDYTFSGTIEGQTISKGNSDFLVGLSALSSTSNLKTMVKTSVPLDIVLVLDTSGSMSGQKLTSLKNAANNFIDATADANEGLDQSDQSRISIVTFASGSNVRQQLNYVTNQNAQQYKKTIRDLNANGATWAEAGLETAQNQLNSHPREDAQKVVIFFTDGQPNHGNDFDNEVAADAVNTAHAMKQSGVTIYAVGVMNGADASVTDDDDFNEYMNGVSSNYPDATAEGDNGLFGFGAYYNTTFGTRAEGDYYKASSNASDIENIFEELSDEIQQGVGSGSPIEEVTHEGAVNPGTLTFTDTLGSYMTVSGDTMTVVYADQIFISTNKTIVDNVDTYHFSGKVAGNAVYKEANLADLTVTVTHSSDDKELATGDVVTVQIPASLLPMRNYDVDTDAKTMSVSSAYPIRLFYGVSVKKDVKDAIKAGSGDVYDAIVRTNKTDDGKVAFYSNLYNSGSGDTTATFTPSAGNKFYYYTQDTNLYVDVNCTQRATTWNIGSYNTLYYSEPYWQITSGSNAQEVTRGIAINRDGHDWSKMTIDRQGNYYIPAGTQRLDRPSSLNAGKTVNKTGTASTVLTPSWEGTGVAQHLGNNGKITYDLPGELEIKKSVDWGNASDKTKQNQNSFEFTVNFNGDETLEGNFTYDVYESGEDPVSEGKVADGGRITLQDGQRAVIKVLPSGTTFTVTETVANKNGFTTTDTVTADPNNDTTDGIANGTISGGSQQSVSFQNNYKADEPLTYNVSDGLSVEKVLDGRDWRDDDEFTFNVQALDGYAPTQTEVTINKNTPDHKASFGTITFVKDGEFRYVVREDNDMESPIAGIDYSNATYRLTVKVVDAGNGNLKIESSKLEMFQDDTGAAMNPAVAVEGTTATFTNYYLSDQGTINIDGKKAYVDTTGDNPIAPNKFQFQMEALGGYVTDGGSRDNLSVSADDTPKPTENTQGNVTTIGNVGNGFHMPTINFDGNDVGNTYVYKITEVEGSEAGMTYDANSYEIEVTVTEKAGPESEDGHVHIVATANKTPEQLTFTNTYKPTAAELTGDDVIHGTKTLEGRQMKEDETFYFQLSALNDNAKTVLADPKTVTVTDQNSMDFTFSEMAFTKVGTYTFQVNEVADDKGTETSNADGMTFDTNIATVTVTVTDGNDSDDPDDHGKLLASVSYSNDKHSGVTDRAQFTNVYKASMNYGAEGAGGIAVTKTMVDRTMATGDFGFTLNGTGPDGEITEKFSNSASVANGTVTMKQLQSLTFDEQDAEKTFSFTVYEADPTDENRLDGVEYDQTQYRVDITVHDNHDGTMYTETTVTKIKNAYGTEANEVVVDKFNSSTAHGQIPTFGFTNTYKPTEASLDGDTALKVTKKVTGAASPDGVNYSFTLTAQDTTDGPIANIGGLTDGKLTVSTNGVINQDATDNTNDDTQTVSFGKLTFSKPGTYTFTVQEDQPGVDEGWMFDDVNGDGATDMHTVKVVVSDLNDQNKYDGALHIKSVTPENSTLITNSYKANPVIVGGEGAQQQITVQKSVTGADSNAEFKFDIEPVIDDTHTEQWWQDRVKATEGFSPEITISGVTQAQAVTNSFAGIQFNAVGEYKFNVTEVGAADFNAGTDRKGWTYDEHTAVVTVKVTDEGNDGQLDAEVVYDNTNATTDADKSAQASAFTNKYEAGSTTLTGSSTTFNGSKTVMGRSWLDGESFGFTMKPVEQEGVDWSSVTYKADDSSDPVAVGENTATATENGNETVSFWFPGSYTFTKAGSYTFNVTETQHNGEVLPQDGTNGMTYDRHTGVIIVTVEDNGQGQLVATADAGTVAEDAVDGSAVENDMSFENSYTPTPVVYGDDVNEILGGNKTVEDHSGSYVMADDQFTFMMRAQKADNPMPEGLPATQDDQGRPIVSVTNKNTNTQNNTATFDFGEITFTKAGTYQYNIYENETNMPAGVSAQDTGSTYTITFEVKENTATGVLTVEASAVRIGSGDQENTPVQLNQINFVNEYNATAVSGSTQIFKTLKGRNWQQGDTFTFDVSMMVDGVAADEMPTFNFDNTGATINDFTSEAGKLSYNVTITASTSATGNTYAFSTGTATYTHEGTYVYTITEREVDSSVVNVTKDASVYTVTVEVTNVNNALQRTVTIARNGAPYTETGRVDFTNTYTPTASTGVPTDFELKKVFTGHEWTDKYSFEFKLTPVDGAPMPVNDTVVVNAPDPGSNNTATFNFGAIEYDTAGTYEYTVTETNAGTTAGGVTYDGTIAEVVVIVTDKTESGIATGKLVATATVTNGTFENEYNASAEYNASGAGGLDITKQVKNHAMMDGQFSFTITATGDNADAAAKKLGIQNGVSTEVKSTAAAAGVATSVQNNPFETVKFTNADDGVTYTYTIKENGNTGEGDYKNYVLDANSHTVSITATDNGDGTMTVVTNVDGTVYTNQRGTVAFVNSYNADPTTVGGDSNVKIEGTKTLKYDILTDGQFTFQVKSGDVLVSEGKNDAEGNITFSDIKYTTVNLAAAVNGGSDEVGIATASTVNGVTTYTFDYKVSEVEPVEDTGVKANSGVQSITVTITDDGNGTLTPAVTYGDGNPLAFENTYGGDAEFPLTISGTKEIVGGTTIPTNIPTLKGGEYKFTITGNAAEDGTPAPMPETTTVSNNASGGVRFGPITYTMANTFGSTPATGDTETGLNEGVETYTAGRTKVFTYTISESGNVAGVTNEQGTKTVEVTVTDLGGGKLDAKVTSEKTAENADFKFTNVYDVTPESSSLTGDGGFSINKTLTSTNTDRQLAEGEFEFELAADGNVVATVKNDAEGKVVFPAIDFTKPGIYNYLLSEVDNKVPGVDYDTTSYNVTANVADDGDGTLSVTWEIAGAEDKTVTYNNTYTAESTSVKFEANKVLTGRDLKEGEFTFEIRENGEVIETVTNDAEGKIAFSEIVYDKPGEHDYEIVEVAGNEKNMTYDKTVYTMHVSVVDDPEKGVLVATSEYGEGGAPVFTNTYTEPEKPEEPTGPSTGVWTNPVPFGVTFTASLAAILAILYRRLH